MTNLRNIPPPISTRQVDDDEDANVPEEIGDDNNPGASLECMPVKVQTTSSRLTSSRITITPSLTKSPSSRLCQTLIDRRSAISESEQLLRAMEILKALRKQRGSARDHRPKGKQQSYL